MKAGAEMRVFKAGVTATLILLAGQAMAAQLVLAIGGEPETGFDPVLGWGSSGTPLFQSTLLKRDAQLNPQPDLAQDWSLAADRKSWTITLRPDARFSDGTPLLAQDVAFTFLRAKAAAGAVDLQVLDRVEILNDHQLRLTLSQPWITFTEAFYTLGIVPKASYGPDYSRHPIGSGPFKMVSWTQGEQLIVQPNPFYYGPKSKFEQITFLFTGPDAALTAAQAQVAHLVAVPAPLASAVPPGFTARRQPSVDNRGLSMPVLPPQPAQTGQPPIGNAVTADPAMRRAINLGIDRALLVDVALQGFGTPAFGPADDLPWSGASTGQTSDINAARAILEAAGWHPGPDGVRVKDGVRAALRLHYPASDPTRQALAETVAALIAPLGIEATAKGGSWQSIEQVMHQDPVVFGFGSHSPFQVYSLYAGRVAGQGYMNPGFYQNPRVEALFDQAQAAPSLEASLPFWREAAQIYGPDQDAAWAWLVNLEHVYFVSDCIDLGEGQIEPHGHGWPITATIENWQWRCE